MSFALILVIPAVVASVLLLIQLKARLLPAVALIASGLQALSAFDILVLKSGVVPLPLIFGIAIAISGLLIWFRVKARHQVSAATILIFVGTLQILESLSVI